MEQWNEIDFGLIEDYLTQNLSKSEIEQVEQRMKTDPAFAREVAWMKLLIQSGKKKKEMDVLSAFDDIHRRRIVRLRAFRIAASVAAVAAILLLGLFIGGIFDTPPELPIADEPPTQSQPDGVANELPKDTMATPAIPPSPERQTPSQPEEAIAENQPPASPATEWQQYVEYQQDLGTLGEEEDEALNEALALFDGGKKLEALPFFEKYFSGLSPEAEDYEFRLEAGKIYLLEARDFENSAAQFNKVIGGDAISRLKSEAKYYLAITRLATGDREAARKLLEEVAKGKDSYWGGKAKEVMGELLNG